MVLTIAFINWTHMVIVVSRTQAQRFCLEQLCNTFDGNEQRVSFQLNVYTIVFKGPLSSLDKWKWCYRYLLSHAYVFCPQGKKKKPNKFNKIERRRKVN